MIIIFVKDDFTIESVYVKYVRPGFGILHRRQFVTVDVTVPCAVCGHIMIRLDITFNMLGAISQLSPSNTKQQTIFALPPSCYCKCYKNIIPTKIVHFSSVRYHVLLQTSKLSVTGVTPASQVYASAMLMLLNMRNSEIKACVFWVPSSEMRPIPKFVARKFKV